MWYVCVLLVYIKPWGYIFKVVNSSYLHKSLCLLMRFVHAAPWHLFKQSHWLFILLQCNGRHLGKCVLIPHSATWTVWGNGTNCTPLCAVSPQIVVIACWLRIYVVINCLFFWYFKVNEGKHQHCWLSGRKPKSDLVCLVFLANATSMESFN